MSGAPRGAPLHHTHHMGVRCRCSEAEAGHFLHRQRGWVRVRVSKKRTGQKGLAFDFFFMVPGLRSSNVGLCCVIRVWCPLRSACTLKRFGGFQALLGPATGKSLESEVSEAEGVEKTGGGGGVESCIALFSIAAQKGPKSLTLWHFMCIPVLAMALSACTLQRRAPFQALQQPKAG